MRRIFIFNVYSFFTNAHSHASVHTENKNIFTPIDFDVDVFLLDNEQKFLKNVTDFSSKRKIANHH